MPEEACLCSMLGSDMGTRSVVTVWPNLRSHADRPCRRCTCCAFMGAAEPSRRGSSMSAPSSCRCCAAAAPQLLLTRPSSKGAGQEGLEASEQTRACASSGSCSKSR
jgi:hypothetical protein